MQVKEEAYLKLKPEVLMNIIVYMYILSKRKEVPITREKLTKSLFIRYHDLGDSNTLPMVDVYYQYLVGNQTLLVGLSDNREVLLYFNPDLDVENIVKEYCTILYNGRMKK